MSKPYDSDQRDKLARTWTLMADAVLRALEADAPSASSLEVARKWLEANNTTLDTIRDWRRGALGFDGPLPTFHDDDDDNSDQGSGGAAPLADALRHVPPFAVAE